MKKNLSIFIGYLDTCSYFSSLCTGFRAIGCNAHLLHCGAAISVGWSPDQLPFVPRRFYHAYQHFWSTRTLRRPSLKRVLATASLLVAQIALLIWMVLKIDVLILKSGESLFANALDIKILRFFKKTIVFFYVGSDSRPPYFVGLHVPDEEMDDLHERTMQTYHRLKRTENLADIVVANPLSSQFHTGLICIAQTIGNTVDESKLRPGLDFLAQADSADSSKTTRILHAPSMPALKGTGKIRDAVAALKKDGFDIEYVEITNRPQAEVMVELAKCDIVIDELYSDSHAGVFAIEACAFGRPAVVCGYGALELDRLLPDEAIVPTVFGHPDRLLESVRQILTDAKARRRFEANSRAHFERATPQSVAERFLAVIEGEVPNSWYVDAQEIRYVEGVCGPAEQVASNISRYVARFGDGALMLDDKPDLKQRTLEFAARGSRASRNSYRFGRILRSPSKS